MKDTFLARRALPQCIHTNLLTTQAPMIDTSNIHLVDEIAEAMCRDPEFDTSQFPVSEVDDILDFFREAYVS